MDENYLSIFNKINNLISNNYILFKEKNIDWTSISNKYIKTIKKVKTDFEFIKAIKCMILELKDPHTQLISMNENINYQLPFLITIIGKDIVVNSINEEIPIGSIIISINNISIKNIVDNIFNTYIYNSESAKKKEIINFINRSIESKVKCEYIYKGNNYVCEFTSIKTDTTKTDITEKEQIKFVYNREIYSNIEYIKIVYFNIGVYDEILNILSEIEGKEFLIIDLRDNEGGFIKETMDIASLFVYKDINLGYKKYKLNDIEIKENILIKRNNNFIGKFKEILILVNEFTSSSSEFIFLRSMIQNMNVKVIGETTAGIIHGVNRFIIDNKYILQVTTTKYYNSDEELLKEKGITPNVEIARNIQHIVDNKDIQLELAKEYCKRD